MSKDAQSNEKYNPSLEEDIRVAFFLLENGITVSPVIEFITE